MQGHLFSHSRAKFRTTAIEAGKQTVFSSFKKIIIVKVEGYIAFYLALKKKLRSMSCKQINISFIVMLKSEHDLSEITLYFKLSFTHVTFVFMNC